MIVTIPDAAFSAVQFCSYIVRRTQYDGLSYSDSMAFMLLMLSKVKLRKVELLMTLHLRAP